ncbi:thiamine-phosphate diphosphorylase [Sutcliffiella horikoshii]|uniref:Thiamine-phosphate synthase n=1 Tax=Sutcliffiella horikoshii TaxID=79883 RepID=A0ABN4ZER6_9BACI|nr:thiamine phosphate synthase [Sutcliffiella horikoshii]ART75639.1 thiamine-phosphate diphosphorylase [Sutcliffiella horikoshii]
MKREWLNLYFVMGSTDCDGRDPRVVLQEAINGGVSFFQFREKGRGAKVGMEKKKLARELKEICKRHDIPFIVNDDIELALEVEADGVHIGQEDTPFSMVAERLTPEMIIGVSCHTVEEAAAAVDDGADYIGVGPMYFTTTKKDIREVKGPEVIREIRHAGLTVPIVGIGGIDAGNALDVLEAGADGVAVISAISKAVSAFEAAEEFCRIHNIVTK